ncbi:unnamed protein product [Mytilus coruscus]|uniref:TIR domain-containing protein n=1 Tax=Mytilus coruscus TaxID=42192 RepID=A0A6J8BQK7_MYTCO|nr:unnamed protein product [Mytilus coruscus]
MTFIYTDTYHECGTFCKCLLKTSGLRRAICNGSYIPKLSVSVAYIKIRNSHMKDIGRFGLINLTSHRVYELELSGNSIRYIHHDAFVNLTWLSVLTVNNETSLRVDILKQALTKLSLKSIRKLRFTNNNWTYLPNDMFDSFNNTNIQIYLTGNHFLHINGSAFRFLTLCEKLKLKNNKLTNVHFWKMQRLKRLSLDGNRLAKVPNFCSFDDSLFPRLEMLSLRDNNIGNIDRTSFICLPKLVVLQLKGISIVELQNNIFSSLKKLEKVNLEKINTLKRIEDFAFNSTSIKKIVMPNCKFRFDLIKRFNPATIFKFCPNVNYLNLGLNYLPKIPNILHSMLIPLDNLETLMLFSTNLVDLPSNLLNNFRKLRQYLKSYNPTDDICKPWNTLYTMAIVLSLFGVATLAIIICIWICQNNIKNTVYLLRVVYNHKQGHVTFDGRLNYEYHAFVVYCDADREWVHNTFLPKMESDEGIKLCIHQRNFDIGKTITANIDKYLEKSWKVVVVMSNNFAKSEWCQWEVDVVQERRRRQGKDALLLIMLKTIDSKHMTSPLRTLLESTPHIRYQTGVGEDLFWRAAVKSLQKPLRHPPVAVL